ncbi:hypothetical protein [Streptomyces clavuligerus]|uniref:hypothetical protein n=1 Tax=Streptomyces clavuligerus TaxID=1901 RepID=UPI0001851FBC|nr:hypothetical protein [Streptomyces clavuligerus]WDN56033.1 ATP/GTP-binding protein [Streptomyces clavuligerus]
MHDDVSADAGATAPAPGRPVVLAPLKDGLPPQRRTLAEDLRRIFLGLRIGVRRYATRRHLDPSTLTRYLNGERTPPWDFIARLIEDAAEVQGHRMTPDAEAVLRDLHEAVLPSRRLSRAEELEEQLADADREAQRITARQAALEEALLRRQDRLKELRGECRELKLRLAEVEVLRGEHAQLEQERSALQEEVVHLKEALVVAQAERAVAEDRCHRLEQQLDDLAATADGQDGQAGPGEPLSITALLDEADRRSVADLVRAVGDLEQRTRAATAGELVRTAGQNRSVPEVAGLLAALRREGWDGHARAAITGIVLVRPAGDLSALVGELLVEGAEEYAVALVQGAVAHHPAHQLAALAAVLERDGLPRYADTLLEAVAVVRPVGEAVHVLAAVTDGGLDRAADAAVRAAAAHRPVPELAELGTALRRGGLGRSADVLQAAVAARRRAADVAEFIGILEHEEAETVFALTQDRDVGHLIELARAFGDDSNRAWTVLSGAAARPAPEAAALISRLHATGRPHIAGALLARSLRVRSPQQAAQLLKALGGLSPGWESPMSEAGRNLPPEGIAALLADLKHAGLDAPAEELFHSVVHHDELVGHTALVLTELADTGSPYMRRDTLSTFYSSIDVRARVHLLLALQLAALTSHLDTLIHACTIRPPADIVPLLQQLAATSSVRADDITRHITGHLARTHPAGDLADLITALRSAGLVSAARLLTEQGFAFHGQAFHNSLLREATKGVPKLRSREFWLPDPNHPGPVTRWIRRARHSGPEGSQPG